MVDALASAELLRGNLHIVSAGLGLLSSDEPVPNYDLTVVPGSSLASALAKHSKGPSDWWAAINRSRPQPLSRLLHDKLAFVALPASYLAMVKDDLSAIPRGRARHLRIFTSEAGLKILPPHIAASVLPYDDRLETTKGFAGTRADFPQRAMRHFIEEMKCHRLSLEESKRRVEAFMKTRRRKRIPERVRATDDQIIALLRRHWHAHAGQSSRLHRYLRDDAKVSCEQGRFRTLWRTVAAQLEKSQ